MKVEFDQVMIDLAELTKLTYKAERLQTEDSIRELSNHLAVVETEIRRRYGIVSAVYLMSEVRAADKFENESKNENNK